MESKQKVAILLCGHIRTWDKCISSFLEFTKDVDCDIFIHTYRTVKGYHPYIRDVNNVINNMGNETDDEIKQKIKIEYKQLVIEDEDAVLDEVYQIEDKNTPCYQWPDYDDYNDLQVLKGKGISIRTYAQYRKFRLCNELRKQYEVDMNIKYDYVVRLRMDLYYSNVPMPLLSLLNIIDKGTILTTSVNTQPCDHIYIGLSKDIDSLLSSMGSINFPVNREYNPHEYLHASLNKSKLKYNPCIHNLGIIRTR